MNNRKSAGFTIIELVVVIVVIGILAAVALPRFLGLQDRAHDAVVEGTQSALASGVVMAQSVWLAEGRDSALDNILAKPLTETCVGGKTDATTGARVCAALPNPATTPVSLDANAKGFPVSHSEYDPDTDTDTTTPNPIAKASGVVAISAAACTEVFEFLLSESSVKATDEDETALGNGADSAFEFLASAAGDPNTAATYAVCVYQYLPDIADNQGGNRRTIYYDHNTGRVTVDKLSSAGQTSL